MILFVAYIWTPKIEDSQNIPFGGINLSVKGRLWWHGAPFGRIDQCELWIRFEGWIINNSTQVGSFQIMTITIRKQ